MPDTPHGPEIDNARLARGLAAWGLGQSADAANKRLQREFYEAAGPRVRQVVQARLVARPELREAAIQEALIALHRNAGAYEPARGSVLPWVSAIAANCAIDQLRKAGPPSDPLEDDGGPNEPPDPPGNRPGTALLRKQAARAIRLCLERLPATGAIPYRQAVLRSLDTDETLRQIAAELGRFDDAWSQPTEEQTRKWIARGLLKLQHCLESKGFAPASFGDHAHE